MLSRVRGCISSTRHTIVTFLALTATTLAQQAAPAAGGASDLAQLYAQGMSEFQAGDYAKAAADLEALLVKAEFSPQLEPAFFTVGSAYFNVPDHKKTIALIKKLHERIGLVDNIVELNAMTVELGDQLYAQKLFADALECYRAAYPREQIVRLQNDRLSGMQRAIDENLAAARLDPSQ